METIAKELQQVLNVYSEKFKTFSEQEFAAKPLPNKWSKKEVLGHLIDSAHNNLRRFICGQYEQQPSKIVYEQEFWVAANQYQNASQQDVIQLWKLVNERICAVLLQMPAINYNKNCDTGKDQPNFHTIIWLAEDYVKHMKHHINQIIPGSFDIIYG